MPQFNLDNYVDVQERITQFWKDNPDGRVFTDMKSNPSDFTHVVFFAAVYKDKTQQEPDSTGWAAEEAGQGGMANKTSWHENCETSAIGRAFANMGYATDRNDRPSRQEMQKVERMSQDRNEYPAPQGTQQPQNRPPAQPGTGITERQISFVRQMAKEKGINDNTLSAMLQDKYDEPALDRLERRDASNFIEQLKAYQPAIAATTPDHYEPVVDQVTGEIKEALDLEEIPF